MEEKKHITAQEARYITETSTVLCDRIFKFIHEEAYQGRSGLDYSFDYEDKKILQSIVAELRSKGYTVHVEEDEEDSERRGFGYLTIHW